MLAIVQHDQQVQRDQGLDQALQGWPAGLGGNAQRPGDRGRHGVALGDRGQLDQPHPVAAAVEHLGRYLKAQPRLAASAGPGQRHQPGGPGQDPDLG